MDQSATAGASPVRERVSAAEWDVRVDLAACYRLFARFGWDDGIFTHNSVRVPGKEDHFLLNPYGLMFHEITASNLVKVDTEGNIVDGGILGADAHIIAPAFPIHSAVHMARPDVACVSHTHTIAGMAVSAQEDGLLPLTQKSMRFYDRLAYHDYEGIANDLDERERLVADLGDKRAMVLRNHGLLTAGRSVAEAYSLMAYLQHSCESQIAAQAGGGRLRVPSPEVCEHAARQFDSFGDNQRGNDASFAALKRLLDLEGVAYAV